MTHRPLSSGDLERAWTHSQEEDGDGQLVFRPAEGDFPPARGRTSFTLAPGGQLETIAPGPDDRPTSAPGRWLLDGTSLALMPDGAPAAHYTIEELSPDRLVLRPDLAT